LKGGKGNKGKTRVERTSGSSGTARGGDFSLEALRKRVDRRLFRRGVLRRRKPRKVDNHMRGVDWGKGEKVILFVPPGKDVLADEP